MPISVLLVDDHAIVREGFRILLERAKFEIAGEASDGWSAVRLVRTRQPDVVLIDQSMPLLNGTEAAREILAIAPRVAIVLLTVHVEEHYVVAALRAGIRGYVVKTQGACELVDAIHEVLAGGMFISPRVAGTLVEAYLGGRATAVDPLTLREREVLQLVAEGKTTKDIAEVLHLTLKTAEYYRSRVMMKLGTHNTAGLVRYAFRSGVVHLVTAFCVLAGSSAIRHTLQSALSHLLM